MFENVLTLNNVSYGKKITYKTLISAAIIALAVVLPQIFHLVLGQTGGIKFLPMYLPVLIGGCLMGAKWGAAIGMLSPLVSFIITSAISEPMPILQRLPFMMLELTVFAVVSGLFSKKISENGLWTFPAVILSQFAAEEYLLEQQLSLILLFHSHLQLYGVKFKPDLSVWQFRQ